MTDNKNSLAGWAQLKMLALIFKLGSSDVHSLSNAKMLAVIHREHTRMWCESKKKLEVLLEPIARELGLTSFVNSLSSNAAMRGVGWGFTIRMLDCNDAARSWLLCTWHLHLLRLNQSRLLYQYEIYCLAKLWYRRMSGFPRHKRQTELTTPEHI